MLSYDGEVKITDFGISRALDVIELIDDQDLITKFLYAPPEVARNETYTRQSDIFSLGLVFYEMLAGFHPYRCDSGEEVRRRAMEGVLPPIGEHAEVPRQLQQILESMLVLDPAGRAQSAGQLYEELIGYLFGNSLQADNRTLALTMQELRSREQDDNLLPEATSEFGLEEISHHEFSTAFKAGGAFHGEAGEDKADPDDVPTRNLGGMSAAKQFTESVPFPGPLEGLYQSVVNGRGKAVLLSGRMGRGRQTLIDRLVDAVDHRPDSTSRLIHTSDDDRFRPFGIFSDLVLRSHHETIRETLDHRREALEALHDWGVSEDARQTMATLWQLDKAHLLDPATRKRHFLEIIWQMLEHFSRQGPFVLVVDRVERIDQASMDMLRDLIATIGDLKVLLVLGTRTEDTVRNIFNSAQPKDFEAIHVSGDQPPTPDELQDLSPCAEKILTLLTLGDRPLPIGALKSLLSKDPDGVQQAAEELVQRGAVRVPRPGRYRADVPNWLTWHQNHGATDLAPMAAGLARHLVHRLSGNEGDRLTPTLLRLYAFAGDRRRLLQLAEPYGNWLQRNAWQHTALHYYQHISELLGLHGLGLPHVRVRFVLVAAQLALEMAHIDKCRTLLEPLNALTETTRDERGYVGSQLLLGQLAMQQDDLIEARKHFRRSYQTAQSLRAPGLTARGALALTTWYERFGDSEAAMKHLASAINVDARRIDTKTRATLLHQAVRMWADRGMVRRAIRPAHDLHTLSRAVPYPSVRCRAAMAQAHLAASQGDLGAAGGHFDLALGMANSHGLSALSVELIRERAAMTLSFERYPETITWTNQIIGVAEDQGDYYSEQRARDLRALAQCYVGEEIQPALTQLQASLRRATERGVPKDVYRGHEFLARAFAATGQTDRAAHHRHHADDLARTMRMSWAA